MAEPAQEKDLDIWLGRELTYTSQLVGRITSYTA